MFKELLVFILTVVAVSFCQDPYIMSPTQNPSGAVPQWGWGGNRYGIGGYWAWGPTGWTWQYPRGWWGINNYWRNNYWNRYYSTQAPGK
ncbi:hypothetical protein ILUMI_23736 [Ignelater luminosus]|uniref:Uncharacterized protein n=1 Tax=Ignelater luminosus TaxID=2038154 RepID=A0A8K0FZD4_IGNLU|nr:hypothetical protein ILUMI_23736 [Ignelater luminosus]